MSATSRARSVRLLLLLALILTTWTWLRPETQSTAAANGASATTGAGTAPAAAIDAIEEAPPESSVHPSRQPEPVRDKSVVDIPVASVYRTKTELELRRAALAAQAEAGDAGAAWALARLYRACAASSMLEAKAERYAPMRGFLLATGHGEEELAALDALKADLKQRCAAFGGGSALTLFAESWRSRALALRSPEARLSARLPSGSGDPAGHDRMKLDARRAGIELLQRRDPLDLMRHSGDLARHAPYRADALALAGCWLLADCRADPCAWWLRSLRALVLEGGERPPQEDMLSPRQWLIVEGQAGEIVRLWRAGRFEDLLRGFDAGALGEGG